MCPSNEEHSLRIRVVKRIEQVIYDLWPDSKVEVFGSFRTGLYLPTRYVSLYIFKMEFSDMFTCKIYRYLLNKLIIIIP